MPSKNEPSNVKYVVEFLAFMGLLVVGAYLLCNGHEEAGGWLLFGAVLYQLW